MRVCAHVETQVLKPIANCLPNVLSVSTCSRTTVWLSKVIISDRETSRFAARC